MIHHHHSTFAGRHEGRRYSSPGSMGSMNPAPRRGREVSSSGGGEMDAIGQRIHPSHQSHQHDNYHNDPHNYTTAASSGARVSGMSNLSESEHQHISEHQCISNRSETYRPGSASNRTESDGFDSERQQRRMSETTYGTYGTNMMSSGTSQVGNPTTCPSSYSN